MKIVDENGHEEKLGEPGEAWAKAPGMMRCYYNQEFPLINGWFPTGDI